MSPSLLLAFLWAEVLVSGTATCPSPQLVSERLAESLAQESVAGALRVDAHNKGTMLSFTDEAGGVRTRLLPEQAGCEDQAVRVLVVLASWLSAPAGPALPPVELEAAPLPVVSEITHTWQLALAPLAGWDAQGLSGGGRLDLSLSSSARVLGWRAQVLGVAPRAATLEGAAARWMHTGVGVSAVGTLWRSKRFAAEADAGPVLSLFTARGQGLEQPARDWSLAAGGNLGSRALWSLSSLLVFADVRAFAWLRAPHVRARVSENATSSALPQLSLQLAVGVAFSL